jgi:hypothetical protein
MLLSHDLAKSHTHFSIYHVQPFKTVNMRDTRSGVGNLRPSRSLSAAF